MKSAEDDPTWVNLAQQVDDLQYILLNFNISPEFRKKTISEFNKREKELSKLEAKLSQMGYMGDRD